MAEKVIFALAIVAVVILYMGMHRALEAPDFTRPPTVNAIHAVIEQRGLKCDNVGSFRQLGLQDGWMFYLARCHDGGRYVYWQNFKEAKAGAMSCAAEQARGYICPE